MSKESIYAIIRKIQRAHFFLVWRDPGVRLKGRISRLPEQPCWIYA